MYVLYIDLIDRFLGFTLTGVALKIPWSGDYGGLQPSGLTVTAREGFSTWARRSTRTHRDSHPVSRLAGIHAAVVGEQGAGVWRLALGNLVRALLQLYHLLVVELRPVVLESHGELVEAVAAHRGLLDLADVDTDSLFGPADLAEAKTIRERISESSAQRFTSSLSRRPSFVHEPRTQTQLRPSRGWRQTFGLPCPW
jgi:hypothetical protein